MRWYRKIRESDKCSVDGKGKSEKEKKLRRKKIVKSLNERKDKKEGKWREWKRKGEEKENKIEDEEKSERRLDKDWRMSEKNRECRDIKVRV